MSANSLPPGMAYLVIGTSPRKISTSGNTHCGIGSRATPKAVACGGWQWTTDLTSGRSFMIARCSMTSLVRLPPAGELVALHVDDAQIVGLHEALGDHRGRADHFLLADAIGDVAVVGGGKALLVKAIADFANLLLDLVDVEHGSYLIKNLGGSARDSA